MRFERTKSDCANCPLAGQRPVKSECGIDKPSIVLIGEAPGAEEQREGSPFIGPAGGVLKQACDRAGIVFHTTHRMNVINCRPPNNDIDSTEGQLAIKCCQPGFQEELEFLRKKNVRVYMPLGATALHALNLEGSITKVRGSVYIVQDDRVAIPTFHPSYIIRGNWNQEVTWVTDFEKAKKLSLKKYVPPKENFNLFPTAADVKNFVDDAIKNKRLVACDIETTSLSPFYSKILMIGLAINGTDALVVPFYKQHGALYWSEKDETNVSRYLKRLFKNVPLMFQNASFDTWHLERHGYPCASVAYDTMLAHHCIHPELPHNLGYIVSVYGETPYWKDVVLGSEERMINLPDAEIRTYNARDTVVLHQAKPGEDKDLEEVGTRHIYESISLKLIAPLRRMSDRGILIDQKLLKSKATKFTSEVAILSKTLREKFKLPDDFNFNSDIHMQLLLYGIQPRSQSKVLQDIAEYDSNPRKKKDSIKYRELIAKRDFPSKVTPLYQTSARVARTKGGAYATDSDSIISIRRAAINRLSSLDDLVRPRPSHVQERVDIENLLEFLKLYQQYAEVEKLASTYADFPIMPDGAVHPSFKIHGTATGRLSSSDPNGQNIPGSVQDIFIARPGYTFLYADYSNIELRVLAYLADEKVLIDAFEAGENIHDINTQILFEIDKSHPNWKTIRRAAKVFVFGRSYGGSVGGIYQRVLTEVPELNLTLAHFEASDRRYFEKLSSYKKWCEETIKTARETRISQTAFGRKRILLGLPDEIERQALNTPIQGTAGEVAERAIIELDDYFQKNPKLDSHLVLTVHDSIMIECPIALAETLAPVMKRIMEKPYTIGKHKNVRFPAEIGIGSTWADASSDDNKLKL